MYAFVTDSEIELFDSHIEAFREYEKDRHRIKAVFAVMSKKVTAVNTTCSFFDSKLQELKMKVYSKLAEENEEN